MGQLALERRYEQQREARLLRRSGFDPASREGSVSSRPSSAGKHARVIMDHEEGISLVFDEAGTSEQAVAEVDEQIPNRDDPATSSGACRSRHLRMDLRDPTGCD